MSEGDIPRLALLDELADRILEHAADELEPERTTLEVTGYADGDYEIGAYETVEIRSDPERGEVWERVEIRYNRQREWIQRYQYAEAEGGRFDERVTDLEAYPDPVALAEYDDE
ncbi:hypothetical protein CV102_02570 [Natronococcus pandeyae]|uniref:Uncharacterized protein n=1 Tax=Natronococcus pandeyae TaxID=2055836 RepID=A0A8J8Q4X6_9EURY|nr:hypothetical protein [Natronococcus pandeyae]TYL40475.1 hypothetical protein CV102_02570 [Natronococcus pandeyae]